MKKIFIVLCLFWIGIYLRPDVYSQDIDVYSRPIQHEPDRNYDAIHYRVSLSFDLDAKRFWGDNVITLSPFKDNFDTCVLDAVGLQVDAIENVSAESLQYKQENGKLTIYFKQKYSCNDTIRFTIRYQGNDPEKGLYFDDENSVHPQVVTTDSWPDEARYWYPCYDYPHDKATQEMIVTVMDPLKVLSNGRLLEITEDPAQGTNTYHYYMEQPHSTYLSMLAIGPFAVIKDSLGSLPIHYWVYPGDETKARWIFKNTPAMVGYFAELFDCPYPWTKYHQVVSPRQGGGAEATSATILGEGVIHDKRAEQDFSWERIIAHEAAHQWWGDMITLRSWEHTWMNESFGTYSDYLYTNHSRGGEEGAVDFLGKKNQYLREARNRYIRPIVFNRYTRPQDNFDSHTYPKGAVILHMLRSILGDKPFFRALSYFLHKHAYQAVDTHDFMTAVKEATGQNMDWFFEQYVFKPGHSVFDIQSEWNKSAKTLSMRITQKQDTTKGIPVYTIPVRIGITTAREKQSKTIWIRRQEETFTFSVKSKPLLVRFDEGNVLLKEWTFDKDPKELLYQLREDDVIGRMWAAGELVKYNKHRGVAKALKDRAEKDPFWAVRRDAVQALSKISGEEYLKVFKKLCRDPNSRVRTASLRALGDLKQSSFVPFFKNRFEKDDSYVAQAEALRSIGKCGNLSEIAFLKEATQLPSPRNVIQRAAEKAIENIESK